MAFHPHKAVEKVEKDIKDFVQFMGDKIKK
jgi:hypothetical protein